MPVQWRGLACAPFKPADIIPQPATAFCKSGLGRVAHIAGLAIAQGAKAGVNVDEAKTLGLGQLTIDQRAQCPVGPGGCEAAVEETLWVGKLPAGHGLAKRAVAVLDAVVIEAPALYALWSVELGGA